ncbi:MAG: glycosyltransferase [Oscillatoriales cyanobacterium RM1_1_9]|nr:glycosyltransferase [Oscillatoriales cyanobacterium RM1_1_9]
MKFIIVNDASTDETLKTIAALRDTRIQVFSLEHNQGESAATNYAIHQARGEFVAILHSDDLWASDKLQKQVEFLEKNPQFGAVLTRVQVIDEKSDILPENSHLLQRLFLQPNRTRFQWLHYFFTKDNGLCQTSTMIRRECYDTVGFYDVRFRQIPDFDFWVRFCQHYDLYIVPEYLTQYRVHQSNISGICSETIIRHTTEVFQILKHYRSAAVYKHLFQIFPELLECYPTLNNTSLESSQALFLLANQALKVSRPTHQLFGLEILYQLLRQPNIATQLEKITDLIIKL